MSNFLLDYKRKKENATISSVNPLKSFVKPVPWVEKYRPTTINEVAYQDEVVSMLKKCMTGSDFPNLLFYGPPGTGKTSTILAAARDLFGKEFFSERVLELNASDERGINVIREKVKNFSAYTAKAVSKDENRENNVPNFKIVILDEADNMTNAAQSALRRTMELECKSTRFCLICNYITRIIDPITSRCAKFRFKSLDREVAIDRLMHIVTNEHLNVNRESLGRLVELAEGDLRRSINMLQSATLLSSDKPIDVKHLEEISGIVPEDKMKELWTVIAGKSFDNTQRTVKDILSLGYPVAQVINQLQEIILCSDYSDLSKARAFEILALSDSQLMSGADEYLQLMNVSFAMMKLFSS